jgi:hypothetical protein
MHKTASEVPKEVRNLLSDLRLADEQTNGRPTLTTEEMILARNWLSRILLEGQALCYHVQLLQEFYRSQFEPPSLPRRLWIEGLPPLRRTSAAAGFRHYQLLPEDKALAVAERGLEALTDDELPVLLLNPFALWDLSDLINTLMPPRWLDLMSEVGRELIERYELEIRIPGDIADSEEPEEDSRPRLALADVTKGQAGVTAEGTSCLVLSFADEEARQLARRIAEHLYGEPDRAFTLRLFKEPVEENPGLVQAELEVSPAPTNDLELVINFPTGEHRTFTLKVPQEVKRDPTKEPRAKTSSGLCDPLPVAAFDLKGGSEWHDDVWPPVLLLRGWPATENAWGWIELCERPEGTRNSWQLPLLIGSSSHLPMPTLPRSCWTARGHNRRGRFLGSS